MKKKNFPLLVILFLFLFSSFRNKIAENSTFPVPAGIDNMLFYIQRTINSNTIIYQLNTDKKGNIIENDPIKIYWMKYASGGKKEDLNFIHRNYGYGIEARLLDKENQSYSFQFVSYKKRQFYLLKSPADNKHHVYAYVNDKLSRLNNIYIEIDGGTFWVPNVKYARVEGLELKSQAGITEIVKP